MKKAKYCIIYIGIVFAAVFGCNAFAAPVYPSFDELMIPQTGCVLPCGDSDIELFSADDEAQKPLTHQKLLLILIEFNDVKIKFGEEYWSKQMFDTTPGALSVVNYWKENANGLDVFEPYDTSTVTNARTGKVSYENYTDVGYTITKCSNGVVKVSLDMLHPIKTWDETDSTTLCKTVALAFSAVEPDFDFIKEQPHIVTIFAGYSTDLGNGAGQGQIGGISPPYSLITSNGINLGRYAVVGERLYDNIPEGIGGICHELGHSVFGLPDLYFSNMPSGGYDDNGLALYSLMSLGNWGNRFDIKDFNLTNDYGDPYATCWGHVPTHLDPWSKIKLGYVTPILVNEWDGDINSISAVGDKSKYNVLEIRSKTDPNQYFLIENRQLIGFDKGLEKLNSNFRDLEEPNFDGGIIIYHIDERTSFVNNNNNPYHTFIGIEPGINSRASGWQYTNTEGQNKFNNDTIPNSKLHQPKVLPNWNCSALKNCHPETLESGISIEVLSESSPSMRVKVNVDEEYRIGEENKTFSEIFPDENFCRAILDMIEEKDGIRKMPDSSISIHDWARIGACQDLEIDNYGVVDLSGIQYFQSLTALSCDNNNLTDISPVMEANLICFYCNNNKIKELDLSEWENLRYLECDNNLITQLDLSKNKNLDTLYCSNNFIEKLDLSQNTGLFELNCSNNKLTELNFENNRELRILECYDNYMDAETPDKSIIGLEPLKEELGEPENKETATETSWFIYYPQKTAEPSPTPTPEPTPEPCDRVEFTRTGDTVLAKLIFEKTMTTDGNNIWLIVAYRENGQLKRIETPDITDMTAEFNYQDCDISVYVWDKNMKPLMRAQRPEF